jgi:hypothetical protein
MELVPSIMMQMSTPFSRVSRSLMTERIPLVFTLDLVMLLACTIHLALPRWRQQRHLLFLTVSFRPRRRILRGVSRFVG